MNDQSIATDPGYIISHWSYSSMMKFLVNRLMWKKVYVMKIYNFKSSPSSVVGSALHEAAAQIFLGSTLDNASVVGMGYINSTQDDKVNWGKTGNRQEIIQRYTQGFQFFTEERPRPAKILDVEKEITAFIDIGGSQLALPAKGLIDLVSENEAGELELIDHKFVASFTEENAEDPEKFLQAMFNYHIALSYYKRTPKRIIFCEYKLTKNKDGGPQRQDYVIEFEKHPEYFQVFYNLYNTCTDEISNPNCKFLPNFQDMFDAEECFKDFMRGTIGFDMPVMGQHKTVPKVIQERLFVESEATKVDNQFLPAEEKIRMKLAEFALPVQMEKTYVGASITLYTMTPSRGTGMKQFESRDQDLALALEAKTIRIQAPIMGTNLVGVEVPNKEQRRLDLFRDGELVPVVPDDGRLNIPIGVDVYGNTIVKAIEDMPHLLVAGSTGSGKSVMLNSIIRVICAKHDRNNVQLVLIDPKRVEFTQFKSLPNLMSPVITEDVKAALSLRWLCEEMEVRYTTLETAGYRNITEYNDNNTVKMFKIVVIIDEFADLILQSDEILEDFSIEHGIVRLAQKARAIGIHLIIGTQRPSVDVVTGIIKANLPTRISFMTASQVDSKVILDESGAEDLIGKGDMLFMDPASKGLIRLQGFYC